jgi:prephenate dehydratase
VLPIESSLVGPIAETHDLLYRAPLSIVREASLPIRHFLLGVRDATLESAKTIRSHPAAFDQCRELLANLHVRCVPAATTADAAREVADAADPTQLAIAGPEAASLYRLEVIAEDVGDRPSAFTRFVALAPYTQIEGGEGWRTALSFVTDHRPGALYHALGPLARGGVNLVQLVSRPLPNSPWRYRFDVVLDGHVFDPVVRPALRELRGETRELWLFGSYPAEVDR